MTGSRLSLVAVLLAAVTVLLNGGAQLLLRGAALNGASPNEPFTLFKSPLFMTAVVAYGLSVLTWLAALKRLPLSLAMPFVSLAYVLVPIAARFIFDEPLSLRWAGGTVLVVAGVIVVASGG